MKVSGPKGPGIVPPPTEEVSETAAPASSKFRDVLESAPAGASGSPLQTSLTEIHDRLRAGEIDATRASELLVEAVVRAQLPGVAPHLEEQLRVALRKLLAEDPLLAAKLRRLAEEEG